MIGSYIGSHLEIYTEKVTGTTTACLGLIEKGDCYIPNSILSEDLAAKMPMVKARKQTAIPSVWTHEELKQLVGASRWRAAPMRRSRWRYLKYRRRTGKRSAWRSRRITRWIWMTG